MIKVTSVSDVLHGPPKKLEDWIKLFEQVEILLSHSWSSLSKVSIDSSWKRDSATSNVGVDYVYIPKYGCILRRINLSIDS